MSSIDELPNRPLTVEESDRLARQLFQRIDVFDVVSLLDPTEERVWAVVVVGPFEAEGIAFFPDHGWVLAEEGFRDEVDRELVERGRPA